MSVSYLPYDLREGYVHDWLIAGPQAKPLQDSAGLPESVSPVQIRQLHYRDASGIERQPVEPGPLDGSTFVLDAYEGQWSYCRCGDDHFVDLSAFYPSCHHLRAWAYTQLMSPESHTTRAALTTQGPVDVWLNGEHVYRDDGFGRHDLLISLSLQAGSNELLVRFEQVGVRACLHQLALRILDSAPKVSVRIPTAIDDIPHRNKLAAIMERAYLDREVFTRDEMITVHWPQDLGASDEVVIRLQTPAQRIYAESKADAEPGGASELVPAHQAPSGPLRLRFQPVTKLYYDEDLRVLRYLPVWGTGLQTYSGTLYGTHPGRRLEALQHAVRAKDLFAQIASMALRQWGLVEEAVLLGAVDNVNRYTADAPLMLVALLGMVYRWGDQPDFPESVIEALKRSVVAWQGWERVPGFSGIDVSDEGTQILLHTGEHLAGQLLPDSLFKASGQTGDWHRDRGGRRARKWLRQRGTTGFAAWDSPSVFENMLVAFSHLMDLSESEPLWQLVTVMMDKLLFTIGLNAYQGVLGATQGVADDETVRGGLLTSVAGVTRLLWGQGIFNHHLAGVVSLACMEDYQVPPLVPEIAATQIEEVWNREGHAIREDQTISKVTYRTPDYMLASVQDYRAGERGDREHVWQATLGPEAIVYTTHPASLGLGKGHAPGFWLGNATLPRVAQWKDVLIALYDVPVDDWMGYTHAYFPVYAFDAHAVRKSSSGQLWAFGRKGDGYVALTASQGMTLIKKEPGAYRELRSFGTPAVWCCQMGRAALDGDFDAFQERILTQSLAFDGLSVVFETLRGETLSFGWDDPFLRDGEELPLVTTKHYVNPYCRGEFGAQKMEIRSQSYLMRLDFS